MCAQMLCLGQRHCCSTLLYGRGASTNTYRDVWCSLSWQETHQFIPTLLGSSSQLLDDATADEITLRTLLGNGLALALLCGLLQLTWAPVLLVIDTELLPEAVVKEAVIVEARGVDGTPLVAPEYPLQA